MLWDLILSYFFNLNANTFYRLLQDMALDTIIPMLKWKAKMQFGIMVWGMVLVIGPCPTVLHTTQVYQCFPNFRLQAISHHIQTLFCIPEDKVFLIIHRWANIVLFFCIYVIEFVFILFLIFVLYSTQFVGVSKEMEPSARVKSDCGTSK